MGRSPAAGHQRCPLGDTQIRLAQRHAVPPGRARQRVKEERSKGSRCWKPSSPQKY